MMHVLSIAIAQIINGELNAAQNNFLVTTDYPFRMHSFDRSDSIDFS